MNDDRFYTVDGRRLPSVTTILRILAKPALTRWLAEKAAKAAIETGTFEGAMEALNSKKEAERGTAAHEVAARRAAGTWTLDDIENPYFLAIEDWFRVMRAKPVRVESLVHDLELGYAGTIDLVAQVNGGETWLVDWKTSKAVYPEHPLQLAAYAHCLRNEIRIDDLAVVLLRPDGTHETSLYGPRRDELFRLFLAAKELWRYLREGRDG